MSTAPTWTALERSRAEIGELVDTHVRGLSWKELSRYRGRFVEFCRDIFRIELTPQQTEGAESLENHRQTLIHSGNGVGKDHLCALWALFEIYVMGGLALLSGPTDRQVREVLMRREIGRLWRLAQGKLPGERYEMAIRIPGREEGGLLAFTAVDPDKFQGHHSALGRVFIGLTEAQGISSEIFEAAQRCQPTRLLAVSNPTTPTVSVYGFSRSTAWRTLQWSCLDHPNVVEGRTAIPGAVTRDWVKAMRKEHGEHSRFWKVSVLGEFPEESQSPLFLAARWDEAVARGGRVAEAQRQNPTPAVLGLDVAREGSDHTALVIRRGNLLYDLIRFREPDLSVCAERVYALTKKLLEEDLIGVGEICVDEIGLGGGLHDRLKSMMDLKWERIIRDYHTPFLTTVQVKVTGFKASRAAPNSERFVNTRAHAYFHLGTQFEEGRIGINPGIEPSLLNDLREELFHHQRVHQSDERILIGSKEEIRKTLGRSPDLADSLAMSFLPDLQSNKRRRRLQFA